MTFEVNGAKGAYDGKIQDDSVRYGKNAVSNHKLLTITPMMDDMKCEPPMLNFAPTAEAQQENIEKLEKYVDDNDKYLASLPPLEYEYRYMPNNKLDKKALFTAAYEEMGVTEIPVKDFETAFLPKSDNLTAEPVDINKDGKIDVPEYSATILAADMMSKPNPDVNNIDGSINSKGLNAVMEYTKKSNAAAAAKLYSTIYATHKLGDLYA